MSMVGPLGLGVARRASLKEVSEAAKASVHSRLSNLSRRGTVGLGNLFHGHLSRSSRPSITRPEDEVWQIGDVAEIISPVTMRQEEALESDLVLQLAVGCIVEVLEVGQGRRLRVSASGVQGWISCRTKLNEPLINRRIDAAQALEGFEVGGHHEVKIMVTVREDESLDSNVKCDLRPGTLLKILAFGISNQRRALIRTDSVEGWITIGTSQGELFIGKVTEHKMENPVCHLFGNNSSKVKAILEAARSGDIEAIIQLVGKQTMLSFLQGRPCLNCSDIRGKTPLIYAAAFGHKEVVQWLLARQEVEVNAIDDTLKSALHHACKRARTKRTGCWTNQADIVQMLVQAKAFLEARDHNGCTAIHFSVANGDEIVTQTLLHANVNVNVKDFEKHTPLDYALNFGHLELAAVLRSAGAVGEESDDEMWEVLEECEDAVCETADAEVHVEKTSSMASASVTDVGSSQSTSATAAKKRAVLRKKVVKKEGGNAGHSVTCEKGQSGVERRKLKVVKSGSEKVEKGEKAEKRREVGARKLTSKGKGRVGKHGKMAAGMQEMAESQLRDADEGTARSSLVVIEEPMVDNVDAAALDRERAKQRLLALLEGSSLKELQDGLKDAIMKGVAGDEIKNAEKLLAEMKARADARDDLNAAMSSLDVEWLRKALVIAAKCKVGKDDIAKAQAVLKEEEPKAQARAKLKAAEENTNLELMKVALAEAKRAKVPMDELQHYEGLIEAAENRDKVIEELAKAIQSKDIPALGFAIKMGKELHIDVSLAEKVLAEEVPKRDARLAIEKAIELLDVLEIRKAIKKGKSVGLTIDELAEAEEVLKQEERKELALAKVKEIMEQSHKVDTASIDALKAMKANMTIAIQEAKDVGVREVLLHDADVRRRRIHNAIEDLKGSIRVFCRVRPLNKKEIDNGDTCVCTAVDGMTVQVRDHQYDFDAVFAPGTQAEIFEDCRDLVQSAIDGYNVTMFAYGQTGAGKTFTMYGLPQPGMQGTSPRTIQEIYRVTQKGNDRYDFTVMASMLELYRNTLVDLLAKEAAIDTRKLNIRQEPRTGMVTIEHLTEEACATAEQLNDLLERGNSQRTVAATAMNSESSRSHLVLIIKIVSVNKETKETLMGKILMCDLAGSERLKKSQAEANVQKESIEINKSLTALGDVIEALTKGAKQIPYRNHKLTQLMQDSLGGTAKTLMFVNCSPASSNEDETLMSLKYATRAKQITNFAAKRVKALCQE